MVSATSFSPDAVTIKAGGKVTFTNNTGITHNVTYTSTNPKPPDDIPNFSSGSKESAFATAGTYKYECSIHPNMTGTLTAG